MMFRAMNKQQEQVFWSVYCSVVTMATLQRTAIDMESKLDFVRGFEKTTEGAQPSQFELIIDVDTDFGNH